MLADITWGEAAISAAITIGTGVAALVAGIFKGRSEVRQGNATAKKIEAEAIATSADGFRQLAEHLQAMWAAAIEEVKIEREAARAEREKRDVVFAEAIKQLQVGFADIIKTLQNGFAERTERLVGSIESQTTAITDEIKHQTAGIAKAFANTQPRPS